MPKSKRKSKLRSEMSEEERNEARAEDRARVWYPSVRCTQRDIDALNEAVTEVKKRPSYQELILLADRLHKGDHETRGSKGLRGAIQRLHLRAGRQLIAQRIPLSDSHLITIEHPEHVRDMRYHMLEDLYAQHPESTLILLEFTQHCPADLDLIIDGHLLAELLIKSTIENFEELHRQILTLWNVAIETYPTDRVPPPFFNPYSGNLNI